ncbi:MAG: hypothetical protein ABI779_11465 [Acidobacteriota bacterium]
MDTRLSAYLQAPKSNGNPHEQALIRRWWVEKKRSQGLLAWEYYLRGCYVDAVWFPDVDDSDEVFGTGMPLKYPINGKVIVLCEAKIRLTPELIGQALVYKSFAVREGAILREARIFADTGSDHLRTAACDLGLEVEIQDDTPE